MSGGFRRQIGLQQRGCRECGTKFQPYSDKHVFCCAACNQRTRRRKNKAHVLQMGRKQTREWRKKNPAKEIWSRIRNKCPDTDITVEWIQEKLEKGKCEITGIEFSFDDNRSYRTCTDPWRPSIDKIDPGGGYTVDNCRLVIMMYNRAKGINTDEDVVKMVKALMEV